MGGLVTALLAATVVALTALLVVRLLRRPDSGREEVVRRVAALSRELERVFRAVAREVRPGVSTSDLERRVEHLLRAAGLTGYLKGYGGYPSLIMASVNEEVTSTPPSPRRLAAGDLLKLQIGVSDGTAYALQGWTFPVGVPDPLDLGLIRGARAALDAAVAEARTGRTSAGLTEVIHAALQGGSLRPSRDVAGHQIGTVPRKAPRVPGAVGASSDPPVTLEEGMVLSLVVVAHLGEPEVVVADDSWNVVAADGRRSALFSHLVVVRRERGQRLSADLG